MRSSASVRGARIEGPLVQIRPVRNHEGERLREIARASKGYWGYEPDWVHAWANHLDLSPEGLRKKEFYVAELVGRVVGWSALFGNGHVCWLDDLWVEPEWIGKGVGTELFAHAVARAHEVGATRMEWEAERHSVGFYEKMGGRYLRDSDPGVWGRVSPVMGVELSPPIGGSD